MKIQEPCLPCIVRQAIQIAEMTNLRKEDRAALYRETFRIMAQIDFDQPAPLPIGEIFRAAVQYTGCADPYQKLREKSDKMMLRLLPELRRTVAGSLDPLQTALRLAAAGNVIDYSVPAGLTDENILVTLRKAAETAFVKDDSAALKEALRCAERLLLIGDNCGEIVLDRLLIEVIRPLNPKLRVFYGVRGAPVINDVTAAEAYAVGMEPFATIVSSGCGMPGTVLGACSPEFRALWHSCDLRIAKGQGNFESLEEDREGESLYCLLLAKCPHIAARFETEPYSPVCAYLPAADRA